jgi:hypothetical protein
MNEYLVKTKMTNEVGGFVMQWLCNKSSPLAIALWLIDVYLRIIMLYFIVRNLSSGCDSSPDLTRFTASTMTPLLEARISADFTSVSPVYDQYIL